MLLPGLLMELLRKRNSWPLGPTKGVLLAALTLSLLGICLGGGFSLWFDEALTVTDAFHPRGINHNPGFYGLILACMELWGGVVDERGVRLLSAVATLMSLPLCYFAFLPLAGARRSAWASLVLAASPWVLQWATNGRPYAAGLTVSLLGTAVLLRALLRDGPKGAALGLGLMGLAGTLQLSMLVAPMALVGALLLSPLVGLRPAPRVRRMCLFGTPLFLIPLAFIFAGDLGIYLAQKGEISGFSGLKHFVLASGFALTPVLGLCALWGVWRAHEERQEVVLLLALACVLGAASVAAVGWFGQVTAQYVFCLLPFVVLLAVWPLGNSRGWAYGGILILPLLALSALEVGPWHGSRPRWREAFAHVQAQRGSGDLVLSMQAGLGDLYTQPGWTDARYPLAHAWADRTQPMRIVDAARLDRPSWLILRRDFLLKWPARDRVVLEHILARQAQRVLLLEGSPPGRDMTLEIYRLFPSGERGGRERVPF